MSSTTELNCNFCGKLQSQLPDGFKFQQCGACFKLARKVVYCDRECQTKDWKKGSPPHKVVCGKVHHKPSLLPPRESPDRRPSDFPPTPDPSFTRSSALENQIVLLAKQPDADYFLTPPTWKGNVPVRFYDQDQVIFKIMRDRAFKNGDFKAVVRMANMLRTHLDFMNKLSNLKAPPPTAHEQLGIEYNISADRIYAMEDQIVTEGDPEITAFMVNQMETNPRYRAQMGKMMEMMGLPGKRTGAKLF